MPGLDLFSTLVAFVGAAYFLMIRSQQKRMREYQSQIDAPLPGAHVILNSGISAIISYIVDTQTIVELAPDVKVTILKWAITHVIKNDEEEFEFTDEAEETPKGEESEESVDDVDAPELGDTSTTEEPVSEKN